MSYTPIHLHSMYSIRDAIIKIEDLAKKCNELKITSCAITDHAFIGAAYKQYKVFKDHNIKPLIGCEFYYTDDALEKNPHYHLIAIAKDKTGYNNLCELSKYSYVTGFYRKPRIDKKTLLKYKDGLIISAACLFGLPQQLILNSNMDEALKEILWFKEHFKDDFYLEIADHNLKEETTIKDTFREIGAKHHIKVVPATDTHYLNATDKKLHNIFKQLAYNTVGLDDDGFDGTNYHVLSLDEMKSLFYDNEIDNTLEISDKCNIDFKFSGYHLPTFETGSEKDIHEYLYDLALKGLKEKGLSENVEYKNRLDFEMEQLHLADLEDYFAIVHDYVTWCKLNGVSVGPGRGSAAGSLVSYLIGITAVDPLQYDLLFARCINPGRALQFDFGV